ncbi:cyclodeaminase/cyclohydrolase family protein [Glutamicibacter sp. MNS18]|uniref:cyclodeaminase/cyclohydrolase family protein n=1 Tax=Glutamicibacter sp. MNS18 TaxID=2989817 RepID=UPI00223613E8|nr:cyclodeaminase/cyclohydrolase family protein [Glutamicibacter sp. MNS18]MCW4465942.1 cyclodeaminase/cyclohydrolase family protein [Glutamicibacter sp. MNS18]
MISHETVARYLQRLASNDPTPGGGAAAALHAATGAALASMVAGFTTGRRYADVQKEAEHLAERARSVISVALHAAQEDERLFGQLIAAYQMPRGDGPAKAVRSAAIQQATAGAAEPLVATVQAADEVLQLAERLLVIGNRSVISDVAAAAESARAALSIALVTLEMNINALDDAQQRERLLIAVRRAEAAIIQSEEITRQVRVGVSA